ncbi:MAG: TonB-dependent receptor [Bacteroidetes bacterium]|nr:TonB-dependent receptor [Bacteroidota bacterium]
MNYRNVLSRLILVFIPAFICLTFPGISNAQQTITGKVTDKGTRQGLAFTNIVVKGTTTGTTTDINGNFSLQVEIPDTGEVILVVSFLGYGTVEIPVTKGKTTVNVDLEPIAIMAKEVVVSGSRVSETILESPASIQKLTTRQIREASSGDFYQSLSNLKGVDINQSSMGFKIPNMRGFNTTSPVRIVQFIDGVDNQAPGLNFPVGNLVGATELDLDNVEVITGAASALYGPNAFQGVISMNSKDPYQNPGTSVQIKIGTRNLTEGQLRFAQTVDKEKKWALKFTGSYMNVDDWVADDTVANRYGVLESEIDLQQIITQKEFDSSQTQEDIDKYQALNTYLQFYPAGYPGKITVNSKGYMESDLSDNVARSIKLGGEVHYKIKDSLRLIYTLKHGNGTAVYQGSNRYSINNIGFWQHKAELQGKRFFLRSYFTQENAGDSYDIKFTGVNMAKQDITNYVKTYLTQYFATLDSLTNGFDDEAVKWMTDSAHSAARDTADKSWYKVGSVVFDSLLQKIITDPHLSTGSKFADKSWLYNLEGQYNFDFSFADVIAGASYRLYHPNSYGTIFRDSLINPGDTLADGMPDPKADYVNLNTYEYGGFVQASRKLFDKKLNLIGSLRADKSMNYNFQVSPRMSAIVNVKDQIFRVSAQSAFRSPTLQNQYLLLTIGEVPIVNSYVLFTLKGNLDGYDNLYTVESVKDFLEYYDSTFIADSNLLKAVKYDPIKPEQVKTLEIGYRGIVGKKLYIDANAYYSIYSNFIGEARVVEPYANDTIPIAGEEEGLNAVLTGSYRLYQIPINASGDVFSYGAGIGLTYYFGSKVSASANYTYSVLDTSKSQMEEIIPGWNTPKHKVNLGLNARKIYRDLGFTIDWKWVDAYDWESTFGNGPVQSYRILDAQIFYEFPKVNSTLRVGCSNLLNEKRREAYGTPQIGRLLYASWLIDIPELSK